MLQALALILSAMLLSGAATIIVLTLLEDWQAVRVALGLAKVVPALMPVTIRPARRAVILRVKLTPQPRRAAA